MLPKIKVDPTKLAPKTYAAIRVWGETRDQFKALSVAFGISMTEFLGELAVQLTEQYMEAKVDNPDDRQSLQDPSGVKSSAVADSETVEPERTGENSQERGQDGPIISRKDRAVYRGDGERN